MTVHRPHSEAACIRCGNEMDLFAIRGRPYCAECRTCPHGCVIVEMPCKWCVRDRHSVWTFHRGPVIVNMQHYIFEATLFGVAAETWNMQETEALLSGYGTAVSASRLMDGNERAEVQGPRYPLIHLMPRRLHTRAVITP